MTPDQYPEIKGFGFISMDKKDHDWSMVPKNQGITVGDFVKVRGICYEVLGLARDWANPNFDCVRFKSDILKNAKNSTYSIVPMPMLQENTGSQLLNDMTPPFLYQPTPKRYPLFTED